MQIYNLRGSYMNTINNPLSTDEFSRPIAQLKELAYNLWWSWNYEAQDLFKELDNDLWEKVEFSPIRTLLHLERDALENAINNQHFLDKLDKVMNKFHNYLNSKETWFQKNYPPNSQQKIAYLSAEYGLHESLPIYAGGLGILSGDHCKSASNLGLPFTAIGLLYREGYFSQNINPDGWQESIRVPHNFSEMPMQEVKDSNGQELFISIPIANREVYAKIWQVKIGRINLYLLDTDIGHNNETDRRLTSGLYSGNHETRIAQEILLGIGGVRALRKLNIQPNAWHMNEGHTAFSLLERARELVASGRTFLEAWEIIKPSTVFTTHTPVPAGHDAFSLELTEHFLGGFRNQLGLSQEEFMRLGLDSNNMFNLTVLSMKGAKWINGVSKLNGEVTRKMWWTLWPDIPAHERPIASITNGIHTQTWLAPELKKLHEKYLSPDWEETIEDKKMWESLENIPAQELWQIHCGLKSKMIDRVRMRIRTQRERHGENQSSIDAVENIFNPDALTIGFARRFATYKRATLIFRDMPRLYNILNNPQKPVQIIFAGKAHPADHPGQELIKRIYQISREEGFKNKIIILEDYNMRVARYLVQGVDIWLNNPRRPQEASGTSGQKVAANGGLNFSILDGWWWEGYNGYNGWSIGGEIEYSNHDEQDESDSRSIYKTLEQVIVPLYYHRAADGIPYRWIDYMKESIKTVSPEYSTQRMVQDYTTKFYIHAMENSEKVLERVY